MPHRPPRTLGRGPQAVRVVALLALAFAAQTTAAQSGDDAGFRFSGANRARYERLDNQFRSGFDASDEVLALQTSLNFSWRGDHVQAFGEIMDSRAELNDANSFANGTVVDVLEPIQAYVAWHGAASTVRVGRMTLDLGKRRVLGRNRYRNTVNNFTGMDWSWRGKDGRAARAFYFVPMLPLPNDLDSVLDNEFELDRGTRDSALTGFFYQLAPLADDSVIEVYALDFRLDPRSNPVIAVDLVSVGTRVYRPAMPGRWNYELEAVLQRGDSGGMLAGAARSDLDHEADFLHLEFGYQFDVPWQPNLMFQYDRASGDEDPTDDRIDRFNTLFGPRRFDFGPTGIYGIVVRSNIDSPGVRLTFKPKPRWQGMLSYRSLRLAAARDLWIGSGYRDTTGAAGNSIGRQLEGSFTWSAIPNRLSLETGFALVSAGRFAEQTAGPAFRGDPRYFYTALTTTF